MGRNCGECKFYDLYQSEEPCYSCDSYGSKFVDSEDITQDCDNCRFEDLMGYQEPCNSCINEDCWKPKVTTEKIDCDSCVHEDLDGDEFPCNLCTKENYMFEPQKELRCETCKHEDVHPNEEPCSDCDNYSEHEPKEDEKCDGKCGSCGSCSCPEPPKVANESKTEIIELPNDFTLIIKNGSIIALEDGEYHATYTECDLMRAVVRRILGGNC